MQKDREKGVGLEDLGYTSLYSALQKGPSAILYIFFSNS